MQVSEILNCYHAIDSAAKQANTPLTDQVIAILAVGCVLSASVDNIADQVFRASQCTL
jgi:hypothetical protein